MAKEYLDKAGLAYFWSKIKAYGNAHWGGGGGGSVLDYYPVGSYYETSDTTFDPNVTWGGTWEKDSAGRVTVAQDTAQTEFDTVGETGGSKGIQAHTHTNSLTLPNHVHPMPHTHGNGATSDLTAWLTADSSKITRRQVGSSGTNRGYTWTTDSTSSNAALGTRSTTSQPNNANTSNPSTTPSIGGSVTGVSGLPNGQSTGSSGNLQPYIVVNRWHRTA